MDSVVAFKNPFLPTQYRGGPLVTARLFRAVADGHSKVQFDELTFDQYNYCRIHTPFTL